MFNKILQYKPAVKQCAPIASIFIRRVIPFVSGRPRDFSFRVLKKKETKDDFIAFRSATIGKRLRAIVARNPDGPSISALVRQAVEEKLTRMIDDEIAACKKK